MYVHLFFVHAYGRSTDVDGYIFPCFSCGGGYNQAVTAVQHLKSTGAHYGQIWLDIEGPGTYWSSSQTANRAFFEDLVSGLKSQGVNIGIYTSASQWVPIMGSYSGGSSFPLWYAHYDGEQSFGDFTSFGGWTKPNMKQYAGSVSICGIGVDKDWY